MYKDSIEPSVANGKVEVYTFECLTATIMIWGILVKGDSDYVQQWYQTQG